jgi:hypothetical protein
MSKIEQFWENATAEDVAKIANTRKSIQARLRDDETEDWREDLISGWKLSRFLPGAVWIDADGASWSHCQVYREPAWWTERPDPGPECRLLGKFPDEELKPGDEYFDRSTTTWRCSTNAKAGMPQPEKVWYRRRIEPVEPKFAVGQTVKVVGPKGSDTKQWSEGMNKHLGTESAVSNRENKEAGWFYEIGCSATWAFREDYLEAVEPEPKHYVLRVGDSVETPRGHLINVVSSNAEQRIYSLDAGDRLTLPNGQTITITEKGFEVTQ